MSEVIRHEGTISRIVDGTAEVVINVSGACDSCHASGSCIASGDNERTISVPADGEYKEGEKVTVEISERTGMVAVFYFYILPFLVVIVSLVTAIKVFNNESLAALSAFAGAGIYYLAVYLFRRRIGGSTVFSITGTGPK